MIRKFFLAIATPVAVFGLVGCATATFDSKVLEDNYYCGYMKEVCRESEEFEQRFAQMTGEEKKEAQEVMKAYRFQCSQAIDACRQSTRKK